MADDSESERPPTDPDESDDSTPDADAPESSQTPTDGASASSDDAESDGSVPDDTDESDGGEDKDADDGRPGADDDSDGSDEVDDVNLEREDLIPPPEEDREADAPSPPDDGMSAADTDDSHVDAAADTDDVDATDAAADTDTADADDASDVEREGDEPLWPEGHEYPDTEATERREVSDDGSHAVADTDGGAPAVAGQSRNDFADDDVDEGMFGDGPESDQEMPLAEHIEEMINRLAVVFLIGGLITLLLYPGADLANSALNLNFVSSTEVINFLWNKHIPGAPEIADRRPRVYGPLELVLTELKVAALGGLIVGLPVFVYETYLFMRPGLFPRERRYYLAAVPTSLILAFIGVAFAHFIVLPSIFAYFTSYTTGTAVVAFGLKETFNLILILMGYNAIIFQIPLFIMLAIMMNLVTREWLVQRRLIFWASFLGLAFFVSPDPTGMAPIIIAVTMITLFEGTLFLLRWTGN
ncbi:sec-independent protein secretion pathway component tatc [Halogeometricum pallidum JCM 14848]|uniref:Sec-independent protein translocase protein TatC n=1 Tax=Halogeometricum pallidum JCM 14848 TaxID=1227487 RepID=M0DA38_HALPD|nr:twin-arginine translocase subunit TatC [Halogeometricum pallidum]ELZ31004.1 sec-independent protein secretion pathway component tatc [Halogeometricum pallidum JCM 14848]